MSSPVEEEFDIDDEIDEIFLNQAANFEHEDEEEKLIEELSTEGSTSSRSNRRQRRYINGDHVEAHNQLYLDYFSANPLYNEEMFRRRFRMRQHLFLRIQETLSNRYVYFIQKSDARGKPGASPLQKCTVAMRALAYGASADTLDEYSRMGETTILKCVKKFAKGIIECFGEEYMRKPNQDDLQ